MSWIVEWKGAQLDIDPTEFTGRELSLIKQKAGLTFTKLVEALRELDGDAIRALFWTAERRNDPELVFGDYEGPPLRFFLAHLDGLTAALEELGKDQTTPGNDGGPTSSSTADSPDEPTLML